MAARVRKRVLREALDKSTTPNSKKACHGLYRSLTRNSPGVLQAIEDIQEAGDGDVENSQDVARNLKNLFGTD